MKLMIVVISFLYVNPAISQVIRTELLSENIEISSANMRNFKRIEKNNFPVCGYYNLTDSLFYDCFGQQPQKVDPNKLKDGAGCCGSIVISGVKGYIQQFNLTGTIEKLDTVGGVISLKNKDETYDIKVVDAKVLTNDSFTNYLHSKKVVTVNAKLQ